MPKDLAIVLNNGGINSAIATALAAQRYRPIMLFIEPPRKGGAKSKAAYEQQAAHFKPYREHTLAMPFLSTFENSISAKAPFDPLVESVPLIGAAARFALHYSAAAIYFALRVGPQGDELARATEFVQIWNEMIQMPLAAKSIEVVAPVLELEFWQVVDLGFQISAPLDRTWSCVNDSAEPCWACKGCRAREAAFIQSAKPDPLRGKSAKL